MDHEEMQQPAIHQSQGTGPLGGLQQEAQACLLTAHVLQKVNTGNNQ